MCDEGASDNVQFESSKKRYQKNDASKQLQGNDELGNNGLNVEREYKV